MFTPQFSCVHTNILRKRDHTGTSVLQFTFLITHFILNIFSTSVYTYLQILLNTSGDISEMADADSLEKMEMQKDLTSEATKGRGGNTG